jgi:hypothetical protein
MQYPLHRLHTNQTRYGSALAAALLFVALLVPVAPVFAEDGPSTDNNTTVSSSEVAEALRETTGVLAASDQTPTTSDTDSAIQAVTAGASVDVPKDASDGVTLGSSDGSKPAIDISLPNADAAGDAKQVAPGTVAYPANNGSANAVQATEDGGVRMLTVIDNPSAPTAYEYKVTVPGGGRIELTGDGGAVILSADDGIVSVIEKPWAKDANGVPVETHFTTDGQKLTQHVTHDVAGVAYPVTADPRFFWAWHGVTIVFNRDETKYAAMGASTYIGARIGGAMAAAVFSVGGEWTADRANARGLCLAYYQSHYYWWVRSTYITRCI